MTYLSQFHAIRPPHESSQEHTLHWLVEARVQAANLPPREAGAFRTQMQERMERVGCKPGHIDKRGHVTSDYLHLDFANMELFGANLGKRIQCFAKHADAVFEEFYQSETSPPDEIIHVTCTGYVSPSGAQKLIANKGWGQTTVATHAYHMGCYGSIPGIRMARGSGATRVDIVHTEMCSLHVNPTTHRLDQLVSESLFADGFIKYSVTPKRPACGLEVLKTREEIIPGSTGAMTWSIAEWGFEIALAKEVPVLIARALPGFLERLGAPKYPLFAVHPGGPKILTHVQELLSLDDAQMRHSKQVLRGYGNMSSATLPHIWQAILEDPEVGSSAPIVSLAFGPGLTICGALMAKRCG